MIQIQIEIPILQKLLRKALIYQIMINLNKLIIKSKLSHLEISAQTGRSGNWLNDAYNNNEDLRLSSISRILAVINNRNGIEQYLLTDLFDKKVIRISNVINSLSDEDNGSITNFILSEHELFSDLTADWGSLNEKKKISTEEKLVFNQLQILLSN